MTATAFGALLIILAGAVARHYGIIRREDGPLLVRLVAEGRTLAQWEAARGAARS